MSRRRLEIHPGNYFPAYVVWELTLRCDQPCAHCGSRAGPAREKELTTEQALGVVSQLAEMKAREIVLIGGEAYLHEGFLDILQALSRAHIRPLLTTGGRGITPGLSAEMKKAGLYSASVSVDGLEEAHDAIRKAPGSYKSALAALAYMRGAGIKISVNTNINRVNSKDLEALYGVIKAAGIQAWQVQITSPLGRAADRPAMLLQPYDLLDIVPRIAKLKEQAFSDGITIMPGNNLGYFGPEEALLRSPYPGGSDHFQGCQAGKLVLGIESDGAVKGCPSLQTYAYAGGSLLNQSLRSIWENTPELAFARHRDTESLWGFCKTCPFAAVCLGGCTFTAHSIFGRPGNNPYCHFRARTLAAEGKRERLVPMDAAEGKPFDHGLFELAVEDLHAPEPALPSLNPMGLVKITRRPLKIADQSSGHHD